MAWGVGQRCGCCPAVDTDFPDHELARECAPETRPAVWNDSATAVNHGTLTWKGTDLLLLGRKKRTMQCRQLGFLVVQLHPGAKLCDLEEGQQAAVAGFSQLTGDASKQSEVHSAVPEGQSPCCSTELSTHALDSTV